jgi:lactate 2-monooxygenase
MAEPFSAYQFEIFATNRPTDSPVDYAGLKARARSQLSGTSTGDRAWAYLAGSAGAGDTDAANRAAFDRWRLRQRVLRGNAERDHSTELFNVCMPAPVILAPIGVQRLMHPDGEIGSAKAAAALGLTFVHSTASATSMEEVAEAVGSASRWYQIYIPRDRNLARSFLMRAEASGYSAIVWTVDTVVRAWRPEDINLGHLPFLHGNGIANYLADPVFERLLGHRPAPEDSATIALWRQQSADPTVTWEDLSWLRKQTALPILVKGILEAEDADRAFSRGADAIIVSNHAGRQLDGAVASLDALEEITSAQRLNGKLILFDSGIQSGADAAKALALGASVVLVGRRWAYGLAAGGQRGVEHALRSFLGEFDTQVGQIGHRHAGELTRADLHRR